MKYILCHVFAFSVVTALAVPSVTGVSMRHHGKEANGYIQIDYRLNDEPAVVTMTFETNGTKIAEEAYLDLRNDVNRLVQPGDRAVMFYPGAAWTGLALKDGSVSVRVRAWPTNSPPDYMVVDLTDYNRERPVSYYTSTNAFPVPLSDIRYRTTHLVMRRIPAANVEFRMGTMPGDYGRDTSDSDKHKERMHWAVLSEDYYLGVYPVTYAQHTNAIGNASWTRAFWGASKYKDVRRDDWPVCNVSYNELRSFVHEDGTDTVNWPMVCPGPGTEGYVDYKYWPRDGHELNTNNTPRCICRQWTGAPKLTFALRYWREKYGLMFDLPTEAQWEFACRAGTEGNGYYPTRVSNRGGLDWLPDLDAYAWTIRNSTNETMRLPVPHPVGEKLPNAFGLYDMLGNVAEWCLDMTGGEMLAENVEPEKDPCGHNAKYAYGISRADRMAKRGGCWLTRAADVRPATRCATSPIFASVDFLTDESAKTPLATELNWATGYRLWLPACASR